ncbi:MAG: NAD(P)/FAD-dependent oxidoreductase [Phycisphaeraceae bacterium]|nr:NAD(P)/FAD-dependent oxidoreductase [Phycisphaerales bacterium]QOJ18237.1 MAG: NAD(P)/FAD-dependent oxidoreductase [Phycisphaeraceae bacterium]
MVVGEFTQETTLLVIGGGPAGYAAAFRAAELGVETAIVDPRPDLGGICLHAGCVPSKTLCDLSATIRAASGAAAMGAAFSPPAIDASKVGVWVDTTVERLAKGLAARAKQLKITRLVGEARFEDAKHVAVTGGSIPRVKFRKAVIATGTRPVEHPDLSFDGERTWTPEQAVRLGTLAAAASRAREGGASNAIAVTAGGDSGRGESLIPRTLLVIGSDYMAVEIASIYASLGSRVTLASPEAVLLPEADDDLMRPLRKSLEASLAEILLGATIDATAAAKFDRVVVSLGRRANVESLDLDRAGVTLDERGFIRVDAAMKTSSARHFAAGDVTGGPLLANAALAQGRVAAEVIAGQPSALDVRAIPHAVFTDPNIAWVGLTEKQAKRQGQPYAIAKAPWGLSGRAAGMNRMDGLTKIIFDPGTREVQGVGLAGPGTCEMIGEAALAIEMGATLDDLALTLHPHPTTSELLADAARGV